LRGQSPQFVIDQRQPFFLAMRHAWVFAHAFADTLIRSLRERGDSRVLCG
jgi:hypothetical protein